MRGGWFQQGGDRSDHLHHEGSAWRDWTYVWLVVALVLLALIIAGFL
jgi:hypothetical protein